jgi:hypothetical protein
MKRPTSRAIALLALAVWSHGPVAGGGLIASSRAWAAGKPKVLVVPFQPLDEGMPDDLGEQTTAVVARELANGDLTVQRADDLGAAPARAPRPEKPADAPRGDPSAGAKAEALISQAKESVDDADLEKAAKSLEKAVKLLEDNADALPDLRLLPEAYLQAGVVYFQDGREDDGDELLNKAVHLDPERRLDPADYPPVFIRVYDRARFNVLRRPRARIEVKAPQGSSVFLDGRNVGKAPVNLEEALPGVHWIRVERPGEPVLVRKVDARSKQTTVVELGAPAAPADEAPAADAAAGIAANQVAAEHVAQLRAAGTKAGADLVLFGGIYRTDTAYEVRTALLSVKDGAVGKVQAVSFDLDFLTAELEVFKLVSDVKGQAEAGRLAVPVAERPFAVAPEFQKKAKKRTLVAKGREARVTTFTAAPAPIKPPAAPQAEGGERAPLASGGTPDGGEGKRPATQGGAVQRPAPSLVPKDEAGETPAIQPERSGDAPPLVAAGTLVPKDEAGAAAAPSTWWIWAVIGVVAAGAVGAGGYLAATSGGSDEGNLRFSW